MRTTSAAAATDTESMDSKLELRSLKMSSPKSGNEFCLLSNFVLLANGSFFSDHCSASSSLIGDVGSNEEKVKSVSKLPLGGGGTALFDEGCGNKTILVFDGGGGGEGEESVEGKSNVEVN